MAVKSKRVITKRASKRIKKRSAIRSSKRKARRKQRKSSRSAARKPRGSPHKKGREQNDIKKEKDDISGSLQMTRDEEKNPGNIRMPTQVKTDGNELENWPKIGLFGDAQDDKNLLKQTMVGGPQPPLMPGFPGANMLPPQLPPGMMPPFMPGMMMTPTPEQFMHMLSASGAPAGQFFPFGMVQNMPKEIDKTGTLREVFYGKKRFTRGGLTKKDLIINARGKVVSKKMSANAKKKNVKAMAWCSSVKQARKELKIVGFIKINRGTEGIKLYKRAKAIFAELVKDMPKKRTEAEKKKARKAKKKLKDSYRAEKLEILQKEA